MEQEFFATFLDEAVEVLQRWESTCLELDSNPSTELLNDLFRSAHNLKGSARSVGLLDFGNFVHKVEDLITKLKVGELKPSAAIVSTLLDCLTEKSNRPNPIPTAHKRISGSYPNKLEGTLNRPSHWFRWPKAYVTRVSLQRTEIRLHNMKTRRIDYVVHQSRRI